MALNTNGDGMVIMDNVGNIYRLAAPQNNPELRIRPDQVLEGQFNFMGSLSPEATELRLVTNHKFGGGQDFSTRPKLTIAKIPVP